MSRRDTAAYPPSWYAASAAPLPPQPRLEGELQADVCILGAGYTGLSAALELAEAGYRVIVLEAERIGWGASGRNGGQAIVGYGCEQDTLERLVGRADARRLFDFSREGMALMRDRIHRHAIACDWRDGHASVPIKPRQEQALKRWQAHMAEHYDYPMEWWDREQLRAQLASDRYLGAIYDPLSGHLHPLEYAFGLARAALAAGVRIFEHSRIVRLERGAAPILHTDAGRVRCEFAVLAGNAWLRGVAPELESRIMPVGTYIGATAPLGEARARALIRNDMAVADVNWALDYFRLSRDHRLLFGGRASYSTLPPPNLRGTMARRMRRVFPQLADVDIEYVWGGYVDISLNRAPHWGRLAPNVYFAQGFSGHGVASTGLAGKVIADAIRGQAERLDAFARIPHRPFPGGRLLRTPMLVAAMAWYKLRDALW
ncbi:MULTISPECIES: FAD-binding oxidoreductase [unclassified Pseudoxanthomonas]|uniref:NAD(P)/FAD-dependent oxidoreductase n=1 Tax=unclassified Pseudoxanthomonas TaxID=2645906 RepID=UPI00161277EC|nr:MULTISPECIES: FAD-binding oxidoreductase [unclassified Pseudoxanthomonas]MBB3274942.1 gamma-glutamylputrescine oxidase [Pseudoxanthomonas sp. OG2]MBV7475167.1 FAD-binding oxidoreductase [Pseudoxanthomonas sp. PXM05]